VVAKLDEEAKISLGESYPNLINITFVNDLIFQA
jgi:hypothetical protein